MAPLDEPTIGWAVEHDPKPRRKRPWYALADVLLRRIALAAFVLIALIAAIVAAVNH